MTPPFLSVGISTFSTLRRGSTSIPRDLRSMVSMIFFLALIMLVTVAKRGVFSLRSQVKTAGRVTRIFWRPKSTSRVTSADLLSSLSSILEQKVAEGIPRSEARI